MSKLEKLKQLKEIIIDTDLHKLEKFFKKEDIHYNDDFALNYACTVGNCDVVKWLINHECSINDFCLGAICFHNYVKLAELFVKKDPGCGQKFIRCAVESGTLYLFQHLLDIGVDYKFDNYAVLIMAMKKNRNEIVEAIFKKEGILNYESFYNLCVNQNEPEALLHMYSDETYQLSSDFGKKLLGRCIEQNNAVCALIILDYHPNISISTRHLVRSDNNPVIYKLLRKYRHLFEK